MVPCEICGTVPEAATVTVQCNGSCAKIFHYSCVDLNRQNVDALAADIGLFWFCSDCRRDFRFKEKKDESCQTEGPLSAASSFTDVNNGMEAQTRPELPIEVWEMIFDHLRVPDLLQTRQVCHHWKQIIDGCSHLLQKAEFKFPDGVTIDGTYTPTDLFPAKRVAFINASILSVGRWWTTGFSENITTLTITKGSFSLQALLAMLRCTTNLKYFKLIKSASTFDAIPRINFRLEKVEQLTVEFVDYEQSKILDAFKWMFPRLRIFTIEGKYYERKLFNFVQARQDTLEELDFSPKNKLLIRVAQLERLRLKKLALGTFQLDGVDQQEMLEASQLQPQIEKLNMHALGVRGPSAMQMLETICRNLPKLRRLAVSMFTSPRQQAVVPTFLEFTPVLEHLTISSLWQIINLSGYKNNCLKELLLGCYYPTGNSLQEFMVSCPNLRCLTLGLIEESKSIFENMSEDEKNQLCIRWDMPNDSTTDAPLFKNIKFLRLDKNKLPKEITMMLLRSCPNVEEMELMGIGDVLDEDMVLAVCQRMKSLRKLTLSHITDILAGIIVDHCHALEYLEIFNWKQLSLDAAERLYRCRNMEIKYNTGIYDYYITG